MHIVKNKQKGILTIFKAFLKFIYLFALLSMRNVIIIEKNKKKHFTFDVVSSL